MNTKVNPLMQFYRKESTYLQLPSKGHFYADGVVEFSETGELAVMPMTAADEIILKNPDALLSGKAITDVITSCVTGVKKPRKLLACDIDAIMIAIREASYGDEATMELYCTKEGCGEKTEFGLNLEMLLNDSESLEASYEVILPNEVTVSIRPGTFETMNRQNKVAFESSKIQRTMDSAAMNDEAALAMLSQIFSKLTKLNFDVILDAINKIVYTDEEGDIQTVIDKKFISEYIRNIEKSSVDLIDAKIAEINKIGITKTLDATCGKCGHQWEAPIELNPVNFL
jgi:hypothetical protein